MKKRNLVICFLILSASLKAQYQSIFGVSSTYWTVEWHNLDFGGYDYFSVVKDTMLFNLYPYKLVTFVDDTRILLKEDTATGKVWCRNMNYCFDPDTSDRLVQDMSLQLGDTFNLQYNEITTVGANDSIRIVDSVYYLNGLKQIRFTSPIPPIVSEEPLIFIEGTGPNRSPFWKREDCSFYHKLYLLCAYKDSIKTDYINTRRHGDCTPVYSGLSEIGSENISISPIPATRTIHIDGINDTHAEYFIIDLRGRQLMHDHISPDIDIHTLSSGIYLLDISTSGQHIVRKILKE